jgi:Uma2 family endonuclease
MPQIESWHAAVVNRINHLFSGPLTGKAIVSVRNPLRLDDHSEPEPGVAVLRPRGDFYAEAYPRSEDVFLLVEVSGPDAKVRLPRYAASAIPEVWVVHVPNEDVWVLREPSGRRYHHRWRFQRGQALSPEAFPELKVDAARILG